MKIGLVGLPGSGKTTCFHLLSGQETPDTHHGHSLATVPLPDPRLDFIFRVEQPRKMTYTSVTFVDFEALHKGEAAGHELALHKVAGDVDAFALVIRCFGDLDHTGEPLRPASDLETLLLEMALSDLAIVERHLERLQGATKAERRPHEIELMERCRDHLSAGGALRNMAFGADEERILRGFAPLTMMPMLVVLNVGEDDLTGERSAECAQAARALTLPSIALCAPLELEISQLPPEEQADFLADYGLEAPARERFLRACFDMLDLLTFFTVNENEARAWTLPRGATAWEAAGKVHSDMQAGFIRAEVTPFARLEQLGSLQACKERGYQRIEGKDYTVQDGDTLQVRFSR